MRIQPFWRMCTSLERRSGATRNPVLLPAGRPRLPARQSPQSRHLLQLGTSVPDNHKSLNLRRRSLGIGKGGSYLLCCVTLRTDGIAVIGALKSHIPGGRTLTNQPSHRLPNLLRNDHRRHTRKILRNSLTQDRTRTIPPQMMRASASIVLPFIYHNLIAEI